MPEIQQAFAAVAAKSLPILQQAVEAAQAGTGGMDMSALAENILNTGPPTPNAGQFQQGNQAGVVGGQAVRPIMPGGIDEQNQIGRQMASPRRGPQPSTGGPVPPGLGNIGA